MGFGTSISTCFAQYATFSGRARRSEFWWFYLFASLAIIVAAVLDAVLQLGVLFPIVLLALVIPVLAAGARRLHDTNRSAWWLLLFPVPFASIALVVLLALEGTPHTNSYGEPPKGQQLQYG
jgi:uncharacterized membrane protein YhaH (DUF805 family)